MARPTTIRDEEILDAAQKVFLARGSAATTAEVAAIAGISEGSIFKRFETKADLFRAAMLHGMSGGANYLFASLEARVGRSTIAEELFSLGMQMVETFRIVVPLVMMSWSKDPEGPPHWPSGEPMPVRAVKAISGYFDAEMRAGRIRRSDPEIVARSWIGALWHFVMLGVTVPNHLPLPAETFLRGLIDNLLRGLAPAPEHGPRKTKTKTKTKKKKKKKTAARTGRR